MNFLQNDTPLRTTIQNMSLKQKLITVHSYDRDIKKWPNANNFEIRLPNPVSNIHSMRLATISLPNNQYVFSNEYQNNVCYEGVTQKGLLTLPKHVGGVSQHNTYFHTRF